MKRYGARAIEICLVGSTASDALVTQEMLASSKVLNNLHVLPTGERALSYLRRDGEFTKAEPVDLILLDLEMADDAGYRLLETIKRDPQLRTILLAAMVSAMDPDPVARARDLHADYLIEKPLDWEELYDVVRSIGHWWLCVVDIGQQTSAVAG
ncbi:MAG TPA: response regulator [Steroidobacteraceae bacterium]|jgi:CheY-like chemotaxis protein|nr:response regulator [Steroidobacteraceae bacterium]